MIKIKLGAAALALFAATALPVESSLTGDLFGTPIAEAGFFGKVKGAAKSVGGAAKSVGRSAVESGKLAGQVGKGMGLAAKELGTSVGRGAKTAVTAPIKAIQDAARFDPPGLPFDRLPPKPAAGQPGAWGGKVTAGTWGGNGQR
jgi:hypothetical protein